MDNTICYLNTDLDITSVEDLTGLAEAFKKAGIIALHVTHCDDGLWRAILETEAQHLEPEKSISAMISAIETFSNHIGKVWSGCTQREFNIGYDCGDKPWEFNQGLSNALLGRIAAVGATLRITLYPDRTESD